MRLTPRESAVVVELCRPIVDADDILIPPASTQEIARRLRSSNPAVKQHMRHVYHKFGITVGSRRRIRLADAVFGAGAVRLPGTLVHEASSEPLADGLAASRRRDWEAAFGLLSRAGRDAPLAADDLERLGEAALYSDHHEACEQALQRCHDARLRAGDHGGAAHVAVLLAYAARWRRRPALADAWARVAGELVEAQPCKERGEVAALDAVIRLANRDLAGAEESGGEAAEAGERDAFPDALALGLTLRGCALVRRGDVAGGLGQIERGLSAARAGAVSATVAGLSSWHAVAAVLDLGDYTRGLAWIEGAKRRGGTAQWFPGDAAIHVAAVRIVRGEWLAARREVADAAGVAYRLDMGHAAQSLAELGEIRLRLGDLDGAEQALLRAGDLGSPAQPGIALLQLARGQVAGAASSITAARSAVRDDPLVLARLLPASVDIALFGADLAGAATAAGELWAIADRFGTAALLALARFCAGAVQLAQGDPVAAVGSLRGSLLLWGDTGAYGEARVRARLAGALVAAGDEDAGALERRRAEDALTGMGARLDVLAAIPVETGRSAPGRPV